VGFWVLNLWIFLWNKTQSSQMQVTYLKIHLNTGNLWDAKFTWLLPDRISCIMYCAKLISACATQTAHRNCLTCVALSKRCSRTGFVFLFSKWFVSASFLLFRSGWLPNDSKIHYGLLCFFFYLHLFLRDQKDRKQYHSPQQKPNIEPWQIHVASYLVTFIVKRLTDIASETSIATLW